MRNEMFDLKLYTLTEDKIKLNKDKQHEIEIEIEKLNNLMKKINDYVKYFDLVGKSKKRKREEEKEKEKKKKNKIK